MLMRMRLRMVTIIVWMIIKMKRTIRMMIIMRILKEYDD